MSNILDQISGLEQFTPGTTDEYVALQLATRLGDESSIARYLHYVEHHPIPYLLRHFHRAKRETDPARSFHSSLTQPDS